MKLYLLRHGDAMPHDDPRYEKDADRPLTVKGIQRTKQLAHDLRGLQVEFDAILSSPLVRARETAEIIARGLRLKGNLELTPYLANEGDPEKLIAQINALRPPPKNLLLVGHEPHLSSLVSMLSTGGSHLLLTLKKGGLVRMEVEALAYARCAALEWLITPRLFGAKKPKKD